MSLVLLELALLKEIGISASEVTRCDATEEGEVCLQYDDDGDTCCDSSRSGASTCLTPLLTPQPRRFSASKLRLHVDVILPQFLTSADIKHTKLFKSTLCNKWPHCPFKRKCQHAHGQEEIDFWAAMRERVALGLF